MSDEARATCANGSSAADKLFSVVRDLVGSGHDVSQISDGAVHARTQCIGIGVSGGIGSPGRVPCRCSRSGESVTAESVVEGASGNPEAGRNLGLVTPALRQRFGNHL